MRCADGVGFGDANFRYPRRRHERPRTRGDESREGLTGRHELAADRDDLMVLAEILG